MEKKENWKERLYKRRINPKSFEITDLNFLIKIDRASEQFTVGYAIGHCFSLMDRVNE